MIPLTQEFIDSCPIEHGFRLRGLQTTRIEVFVDAAFAFAVTILVISFDNIPSNFGEMVEALKVTPAFTVAVAQLVWIWYAHNTWSRRFGLDDAMTVFLSTALLIVVLVYVYPLKILAEGAFYWLSSGWLPSSFEMSGPDDLPLMFVFLGSGFVALCMLFLAMNSYAARHWKALRLNELERYHLKTVQGVWILAGLIGLFSIALALLLPHEYSPFAGFGYALLGVFPPIWEYHRYKHAPAV